VPAAEDRLAAGEQRGRPGRAVVVDVDHRDAGEPELVDGPLPAGAVAVHVAGERLVDVLVVDAGVLQRRAGRVGGHHVIIVAGPRLGELDHADPDDVDCVAHGFSCSPSNATVKTLQHALDER
jgi:hypothetical protein